MSGRSPKVLGPPDATRERTEPARVDSGPALCGARYGAETPSRMLTASVPGVTTSLRVRV
ncbi:hypothetical protein Aph01nite_22400 [Acrocarpospora phusangensis]|uniref:Uncharacterized protein n=1 Tax=Acrocarpospora phusangensis TaxID=1070424 RepID=A0A919UPT4_9ACTN|nr:hypothetical protein Aph01nite_22400 [Acrocarpospora phusangensis]